MPTNSLDVGAAWANVGRNALSGQYAYDQGRTRMAQALAQQEMMGAHSRAFDSQAALNAEKVVNSQQRRQYQSPEFSNKIAAAMAGLSDTQGDELANYQKSGNWGVTPAYPDETKQMTMAPTQKSAPSWYSPEVEKQVNQARGAHLANLGATGNTEAAQLADAFGKLQTQGRINDVVADPSKAGALGRAMAASEGKALFNQGANGVMDQFTGAETLNAVGKSAATENLAQAGNASASAALHRAQIPEVQSRIDLNRSKIGADQVVINPDGTQTIIKGGKPSKAPTEFQAKSATYGARAKEAHDIMNELEAMTGGDAYNRLAATSLGGNGILNTLANPTFSQSTQKAIQAQRDFMNAVLRQESGAVIGPSEFADGVRQYFPQPGDKPEVLEQKRRNRETAIMGFNNSAGPAAFEAPPVKQNGSVRTQTADRVSVLSEAKAAIAAGAPRAAVIQRLREMGIKEGAI